MKGKRLVSLLTIAMLFLTMTLTSLATVGADAPPPGATWMWVDDSEAHFGPTDANLTGTEFLVPIKVQNVTFKCGAFEFKLSYDTTLLDAIEVIPALPPGVEVEKWLPEVGGVWAPIRDAEGYVWVGCIIRWGYEPTGDFSLVNIKFKITLAPPRELAPPEWIEYSCPLHLYDTGLTDEYGLLMPHSTQDGVYSYKRSQIVPGAPVADFTWSPAIPYEGDTVTVTSTSTPNGGAIISYDWEIVSGPATWVTDNGYPTRQFHCDGPGTVVVRLNVTDDEGMWDDVTHEITQLAKAGAIIDLYTSPNRFCGQETPNIGKGPDQPCDALSPDVNVTLYAAVSWNGAPVNHVLVAFEVRWMVWIDWQLPGTQPNQTIDECVLYRTAETDKDGIARIWFRVPTPCTGQMFGKWIAIATCKVQEVKIEDTMPFDVGYLVTILEGGVTVDKTEYIREQDTITVTVLAKNIAQIPKHVTFVATFYDDCDVPIGQKIVDVIIPQGVYCSPYLYELTMEDAILVPQYAYVGIGKVYVSAFTALPSQCGVAYCPEKGTTFIIKYVAP